MDIIKIGIFGITGVLFALQFKSEKQEYGFYIGFAVCLIIFSIAMEKLVDIWGKMDIFQKYIDFNNANFKTLLKVVGITYICEFSAAICKDAGHSAIAGQIEVFGKLSVLAAGMPILLAIIENISEIAM